MRLHIISPALLAPVLLHGQITITQADMPVAVDTLRYWNGTAFGFDGADTGPNHTWDFGQLVPLTEGADTVVTVGSTPFLYQFFFNNPILYPDHDADLALRGADFGVQQLQVEDVFDYYKSTSSSYRNVGFGANINGLPSSLRRIPVDYVYRFPLDYADADSSFSAWEVSVPTLLFFRQEQWRHNEVDGWGTLYLPTDTFTVLRVRSRLERTDSIFVSQLNLGFTLPEPETIEYKWLALGVDQPVLQVTTTAGIPAQVRFLYDPNQAPSSIAGPSVPSVPDLYPNPASDVVFVRMPANVSGDLVLLDASGRELRRVSGIRSSAVVPVDLGGLSPGTYVLRISGDATGWSGRLVVDR